MAINGATPRVGKILDLPDQTVTIGTATDGGTGSTVSVAFTAGSIATGGPVSYFTATSTPGSFTANGTSSPITVSGLTDGTAYTFKVKAGNPSGYSTAGESAASNSVTPAAPGVFESIATLSGSGVSTITFSSIPSTYKSLQIRAVGAVGDGSRWSMRFNADTGSNYWMHYLLGSGSSASASSSGGVDNQVNGVLQGGGGTTFFGASIMDIVDYASTSKYKTLQVAQGVDDSSNGYFANYLKSGLWLNTSAVTSITIFNTSSTNGSTGTTFALYGIKG